VSSDTGGVATPMPCPPLVFCSPSVVSVAPAKVVGNGVRTVTTVSKAPESNSDVAVIATIKLDNSSGDNEVESAKYAENKAASRGS